MNILVLEAGLTGHHGVYLQHIVNVLVAHGHSIMLALPSKSADDERVCEMVRRNDGIVSLVKLDDERVSDALRSSVAVRELKLWWLFRATHRKLRAVPDVVLLPYADYCLYACGLLGSPFGSTPMVGICMRPAFHLNEVGARGPRSKVSWLKRHLFRQLLRRDSIQLLTIDELLHRWAVRDFPGARISYLADPAELCVRESMKEGRARWGVDVSAIVVLVYGVIDERKGINKLLAVAAEYPNLVLLFAGRHEETTRSRLERDCASLLAAGKLICVDRFVSKDEEASLFAASDIVWLGYEHHYGSSGVLVLAASAQKPVVASPDGLIGWYAAAYRLGCVLRSATPEDVRRSLDRARTHEVDASAIAEFLKDRDWGAFARTILSTIEKV